MREYILTYKYTQAKALLEDLTANPKAMLVSPSPLTRVKANSKGEAWKALDNYLSSCELYSDYQILECKEVNAIPALVENELVLTGYDEEDLDELIDRRI